MPNVPLVVLIATAAFAVYAAVLSTAMFLERRREKRERLKTNIPERAGHKPQWEEFNEYRKQSWEDIQSSSDSFDRSMLTTSSAALGVSLVFLKDFVPLKDAASVWALYLSWSAFASCIVATVLSFRLSIAAHVARLDDLWLYHIKGHEDALNRQTLSLALLTLCNTAAMITFVLGIASTLLFVFHNLTRMTK